MPLSDPETWVDRYGDMLFAYALTRVRNRDAAEDLVQETLIAAFRARDRFEGRSQESTWMVGILKNKIIDHFRKTARDPEQTLPFENEELYETSGKWAGHWRDGMGPRTVKPETEAELNELREKLDECVQSLPARMSGIFALREMDGISTEELCKRFEISPTNLGVILYRARAQLRRCLENYWVSA